MLNGCKSCSIFAIRDIELYFIFIAKAYKTGNINLGCSCLLSIRWDNVDTLLPRSINQLPAHIIKKS